MSTCESDGHGSYFRGDIVNVCDCLRVNESILSDIVSYLHFFLRKEDDRIFTSDGDSSESTSFDCFEGVFHLIETTLVAEDGDVVFAALS